MTLKGTFGLLFLNVILSDLWSAFYYFLINQPILLTLRWLSQC